MQNGNNFIHEPFYDSPQLRSKLASVRESVEYSNLASSKGYSQQTTQHGRVSNSGRANKAQQRQSEVEMSEVTREELQANLKANKAEAEAIASEMRREMAEWREQNNQQLSQLTIAINELSSKVNGKMDSVDGEVKAINGKFDGIQGQITGINTAISGIQSGISTRLVIFAVVIAVIVAIPGLIAASKDSPASQATQVQPIVIQVPQPAPSQVPPETK